MKKIFVIFATIILVVLTSASYGADKLTVLLDWFMNPDHAPLFVTKEKGYFAQKNLDVDLIGPADPADPPKLVAAGKADIAITYQPEFLEQVDQGLPLIMIGTLINKPLTCLVVMKNSAIKSIHDLKGKQIGYSGGGKNNAILKIMLEKHGMSLNDVNMINIHYNLTQALLSGKVDAVTGMMRNFEVTQIELTGSPALAFYPEEHGMPNYSELVFVVNNKTPSDSRYSRFLSALQLGTAYLRSHPEETWREFAKTYPELNNELNRRAWFATIPYFADKPAAVDTKAFVHFAQFMQKNGLIKTVQPLTRYTTIKE
jgi:putative hydroxymethylpyrimidine transport system substrate-binding protein